MFKVEVSYGSDPIALAALNRRVHDRLIEGVFDGRSLDVLDETQLGLLPELAPTKAAE